MRDYYSILLFRILLLTCITWGLFLLLITTLMFCGTVRFDILWERQVFENILRLSVFYVKMVVKSLLGHVQV